MADRPIDSLGDERLADEPEPVSPAAPAVDGDEPPAAPAPAPLGDTTAPSAVVPPAEEDDEETPLPGKPGDLNYTKAVEKRIAMVRRKQGDAERDRDFWKDKATSSPAPAAVQPAGPPEPKEGDFQTNAEYVKALATWQYQKDRTEEQTRAQQDSDAEHIRTTVEKFTARTEESKIRERHPDYDEIVDTKGQYSPAMKQLVLESEHGPELAYYLGTHEEASKRIAAMSPLAAAKELGKLEVQLTQKPAKRTVTNATEPITPLSGDDVAGKSPDDMGQDEYETWRKKQAKATV